MTTRRGLDATLPLGLLILGGTAMYLAAAALADAVGRGVGDSVGRGVRQRVDGTS